MKDFRNLHVWRKAHELTLNCYKVTSEFPKAEQNARSGMSAT